MSADNIVKANPNPSAALKAQLSELNWPREGLVVDAHLIKKSPRVAYFDLGKFGTGLVFGGEYLNAKDIIRDLEPGGKVSAKILDLDGEDGFIELSLTEATRQRVWQQVQELQESGDIVKVKVLGVNPGGFTVQVLELKGFLPFSQMSPENYPKELDEDKTKALEESKKMIGREMEVKIINVNGKKNKLIVSERDTIAVNVKELLAKYEVGQIVDGIVSGIADFGIFVRFAENPQIEGLVHISEIDHRIIDNPKETVKMNEEVKIKIIDIKDGRVFLSLKALKPDPWLNIEALYKTGQEVSGRVHKFNPFGAVIDLDGGIQGLIHVSEFGSVDDMKNVLKIGEPSSFQIASIKPEEKRLVLKPKK